MTVEDNLVARAVEFMSDIRCFLHYSNGRNDNTLTYELQTEAAARSLGVGGATAAQNENGAGEKGPEREAAEWMRMYFRQARTLNRRLLRHMEQKTPLTALSLRERIFSATRAPAKVELSGTKPFIVRDGLLEVVAPGALSDRAVRISGAEFLTRYKGTTDPITRINPERQYAVRVPTAHPIYEHHRVLRFAELLCRGVPPWAPLDATPRGTHGGTPVQTQSASEQRLQQLGELMYQSHESYSACGLNSEGTDLLVNLVREAGPGAGLYGAKITGGGSGGTVAVLGTRTAGPAIEMVCEKYAGETKHRPYVFAGSSPGSAAFGHLILEAIG